MIILLHSSKTMRPAGFETGLSQPLLIEKAEPLAAYLKTLTKTELSEIMKISPDLATATSQLIHGWETKRQRMAIDSFLGDIYSGLQVSQWSAADRVYADKHLRILSGLYGILRPSDGIYPYRLEMGYRLPAEPFRNLYTYWGDAIGNAIPESETVINLTAAEYSKALGKTWQKKLITPRFLTISPKTGQPTFVVVHAKIARGAFASWLIRHRIDDKSKIAAFDELGYAYDTALSSTDEPVFVCQTFEGLGLSVRLS